MHDARIKQTATPLSTDERKRRKREIIIIFAVILLVSLMTYAENRIIHFGADFPISNTILMFILININLLLLILLIFLVFRNLVKLLYDRRRKVMGSKLRTKLAVAFIALTLLPTTVLFFFSLNFITISIEFWFNVPVEQALENSLKVGRTVYQQAEETHRFFLERIAYQIKTKKLLDANKSDALARYIQVVQRAFNLDVVEIYDANANRLNISLTPDLEKSSLKFVSADSLQKDMTAEGIHSFTETIPTGELYRTVGTIPFGVPQTDARAFVVLSLFIPPDLAQNMSTISRGFEAYQQIKLLKKPIQATYYITLSIVALLVVFCAIWFGFYLAKSITIPIMELAKGTRRVAEGDLGFSIGHVADDEIGSLVDSFNKMTKDLRNSREQLEFSARVLRQQNTEIEERRQYIEVVLKNVSAGVITIDAAGLVTTMNKSAEKMLSLSSTQIINRSYRKLLGGRHREQADEIMEKFRNSHEDALELSLRVTISGRPRSFMGHLNALKDDTGRHMGIVTVFDDLTDLEKAQRMAAWREVARRIAHEVKNPLTPISLSAQRLNRKYSEKLNESVFDECTRMIIDQVESIRNLVNEFSAFARFPTAHPVPCDLVPIIDETLALYREGHLDVHFQVEIAEDLPQLNLDRQQIKQAMINLVDNAISAIKENGTIFITMTHLPALNRVRLEVGDTGPGISDKDKTRLFEPYFSTKKAGMGLGLTIVNTIIEDHNGRITVQESASGGAQFVIELPV